MALLSLPQTVRLRCLLLSRFERLNQSVPAQVSHHRLVCQACVPLSPLCLPYSPFVSSSVSLLLPAAAAWLGFLFCSTAESSWVLLLFWKECESVWLLKTLSGDLGGQSPKIWFWTSFGPRSHLVKIAASQNPARRGFGKALQWFATWSAAAAVVACAAASGQGAVFWAENQEICESAGSCAEETKSIRRWPEKRKSIRSAVCHGEVDERVDWHEAEFTTDTTGLQRRSHPSLYVGNAMKLGVPCGGWSFWLFKQAEDYWCLA